MIQLKNIYFALSPIFFAISLFIVWFTPMTYWWCSVLMCANFLWILFIAWKAEGLTPFFLFLATFVFLFIGGRFWTVLFGHDPHELIRGNFFNWDDIPWDVWLRSMTYILLLLYGATLAYIIYPRKNRHLPILSGDQYNNPNIDFALTIIWCLIAPFIIYDVSHKFAVAVINGAGYLSLYANQMKDVIPGSGFISSMLYVFFGIAMTLGGKKIRRLFMLLIFFKALVFIVIGQRGKFGCMILFFIWYYYRNKKINLSRLIAFGVVGLILIGLLVGLSGRGVTDSITKPITLLDKFLFSQGVSISTFTLSQSIDSYPLVPYFVSFIPGFASFYSLFDSLPAYEAGFANYLAYTVNIEMYESGHGLGWTLLSDFYLYSGKTLIGFTLLSILFGLICAKLEDDSKTSPLAATIVYALFFNFTFLPRAGLYTIIPLIVWILIMYYLFTTVVARNLKPSYQPQNTNI